MNHDFGEYTRNEAAERLRDSGLGMDQMDDLDEALAAERSATVERIRERYYGYFSDEAVKRDYAFHPSVIFAILDEEAAR
jgi:hypothetical protein